MSDWKTAAGWAAEGLKGMPGTKRGINMIIGREGWRTLGPTHARKRNGAGGGWEYHVSCLPMAARLDWINRRPPLLPIAPRLAALDAILTAQIETIDSAIAELQRRRAAALAMLGDRP